jgi:methionyl-tRNA formyltransferase
MNVACFGYRKWALDIFKELETRRALIKITDVPEADVVLFYGWSDMIPEDIYNNKLCFILHPSPLPKYRGGSPIQHQIINGEKESAVTICRVTDKLDSGNIYSQTEFSLEGTLDDIFAEIIRIGVADTLRVLSDIESGDIKYILQDDKKATTFKRRKPEESEIKDIQLKTVEELYNFIRALNDPYPNAFIKCKDGKKLYLTGAHL